MYLEKYKNLKIFNSFKNFRVHTYSFSPVHTYPHNFEKDENTRCELA